MKIVTRSRYRKSGPQAISSHLEIVNDTSAYTAVFAVGEVPPQYKKRMLNLEDVTCHAAYNAPQRIELVDAVIHFFDDLFPCEMFVTRHGKRQRVVLPVGGKLVRCKAAIFFHSLPQVGTRQRGQEQHVEEIHAVTTGSVGDVEANTLPV